MNTFRCVYLAFIPPILSEHKKTWKCGKYFPQNFKNRLAPVLKMEKNYFIRYKKIQIEKGTVVYENL